MMVMMIYSFADVIRLDDARLLQHYDCYWLRMIVTRSNKGFAVTRQLHVCNLTYYVSSART